MNYTIILGEKTKSVPVDQNTIIGNNYYLIINPSKFCNVLETDKYLLFVFGKTYKRGKKAVTNLNDLMEYLIQSGVSDFANNFVGTYHILFVDKEKEDIIYFTDPFRYYSSYISYHESGCIISDDLDRLTTLIEKKEINVASVYEKLLFNYYISDYSLYEGTLFFPTETVLFYSNGSLSKSSSGLTDNLLLEIDQPASLEEINSVFKEIIEGFAFNNKGITMSLTGGWDGRLILSYLLALGKDPELYSFGDPSSEDIMIPKKIASRYGLEYAHVDLTAVPVQEFVQNGIESLFLCDSLRNFNFGHYRFALKNLSPKEGIILTGNCGSNLFKSLNSPGSAYNENLLILVKALHEKIKVKDFILSITEKNQWLKDSEIYLTQIYERVYDQMKIKQSLLKTFYKLLYSVIESRYFGGEAKTYSDIALNFTPFLDIKLLSTINRSKYSPVTGGFFDRKDIIKRFHGGLLYASLIEMNFPELNRIETDRGYALQKYLGGFGLLKSITAQITAKRNRGNGISFDGIFQEYINRRSLNKELWSFGIELTHNRNFYCENIRRETIKNLMTLYDYLEVKHV